jgi:hypothetical protein
MCNEAAHLVDRVLPNVPVRQWVLSLPFELRRLAAFRADVLSAVGRAFVEAIFAEQRKAVGKAGAEAGAITFVQRFGGSLNLNVHFHVVVIDGVFTFGADGRARFHEARPPTPEQIERVARLTYDRALRWLRKHGHLDERDVAERSTEPAAQTAIDACAAVALRGGTFEHRGADRTDAGTERVPDEARFERRPGPFTAEHDGFNVQAAVRIAAEDDEGRERLLRYCARPAFALERLELLADGRVAYRLKVPTRRATHRLMTPVEFLARLAALVPPPRYPLVRYHGVLAPHSKRRASVVPRRPSTAATTRCTSTASAPAPPASSSAATAAPVEPREATSPPRPQQQALAFVPASSALPTWPPPCANAPPRPAPVTRTARIDVEVGVLGVNVITIRHAARLLDGLLIATSPRLDWARLLRRTYEVDVLACPACHGRLRPLAAITDPAAIRRVLDHLGSDRGDASEHQRPDARGPPRRAHPGELAP